MLLRHLRPPLHHDVSVHVEDPDATIADLAAALEPDEPAGPLLVDGQLVAAATPLDRAAMGDGATVQLAEATAPPPASAGRPPLLLLATVTSGFDAGRSFALGTGVTLVGRTDRDRAPEPATRAPVGATPLRLDVADATVSTSHLRLEVGADGSLVATDLGSTNGTYADGIALDGPTNLVPPTDLRLGACTLCVDRPPPPTDPLPTAPSAGSPTRPLHRRPRRLPAAPPPPVEAPAPLDPGPPVTPVGAIAVVASMAVGGVMVVVLGSWTYAAFALLGPVLLIAGALDGRHRRRRTRRRGDRRRRAQLARLEADLAARAEAETAARLDRYPGVAAAVRIATRAERTCWERRPGNPDAFAVRLGHGAAPWDPPVREPEGADVLGVIARHRELAEAPIGLTLEPGRALALVGSRAAVRSLARALVVQAATVHGPADLRVAVLVGSEQAAAWHWCAWLPHTRAGGPALAADEAAAAEVVATLAGVAPEPGDEEAPAPRTIVVVDHPSALAARRSAVRTVLRAASDPARGLVPLVLVDHERDVPASCEVVLTVGPDGALHGPPSVVAGPAVVGGIALDLATDAARALARFDDPELTEVGRGLPAIARLGALLGPDRTGAGALAARWRAAGPDPAPRATLGAAADGPFVIDLAADGPHALVAGTTGSGKSELLRSLVASLAVSSSPDHLTFVLVDFKGGGAFDACARLPHTTGVVTDLDGHLAQRALRCLDAELRHRERRLRAVGADDLADLRRRHPHEPPLPRLVVVVDEFATLAAELPEFVASLVGVAQRGRSLGVHLVLATQRPSGSVSDHIRANAALRIALRVQAPADSTDVIDVPDAAALPRHRPGRALVRLGPGELVPIQAALATGPSSIGGAGVRVTPLGLAADGGPAPHPADTDAAPPLTDLATLVAAAVQAWATVGGAPPRRPWPEPLPAEVPWPLPGPAVPTAEAPDPAFGTGAAELVVGLADHPDRQAQEPFGWHLGAGPLLVVGLPGSGTTTAAATAVLAAARRWSPAECHVHAVDLGAGELQALAGLPHVGAVVAADDLERQRRLLADVADDLAARRARPDTDRPRRVVVIDGLAGFRARWDDVEPSGTWYRLVEVTTRGAEVGIHVLLTAEGPAATPHRLLTACAQRLVLRLGDRADHAAFGIPSAAVPALPPGRGVLADGPTVVQVARPPDGLAAAVARQGGWTPVARSRLPRPVGVLGADERLDRLDLEMGDAELLGGQGDVSLLLGRSDRALAPAYLPLASGGHALVAGPPRSGRSTALVTLARSARACGLSVLFVGRPGPEWGRCERVIDPDDAGLAEAVDAPGPLLVLVDDAERTADDHAVLRRLVHDRRPDRHVVAAGRSDRLRTRYGHWTREVLADRCGLLLRPDVDLDGDLLAASLPRRLPLAPAAGRGWLVGGRPEGLVQVGWSGPHDAHPSTQSLPET